MITPVGRFRIAADNGLQLAVCKANCGSAKNPGNPAILALTTTFPAPDYIWTINPVPGNIRQVTITGSNGNYLTRC